MAFAPDAFQPDAFQMSDGSAAVTTGGPGPSYGSAVSLRPAGQASSLIPTGSASSPRPQR